MCIGNTWKVHGKARQGRATHRMEEENKAKLQPDWNEHLHSHPKQHIFAWTVFAQLSSSSLYVCEPKQFIRIFSLHILHIFRFCSLSCACSHNLLCKFQIIKSSLKMTTAMQKKNTQKNTHQHTHVVITISVNACYVRRKMRSRCQCSCSRVWKGETATHSFNDCENEKIIWKQRFDCIGVVAGWLAAHRHTVRAVLIHSFSLHSWLEWILSSKMPIKRIYVNRPAIKRNISKVPPTLLSSIARPFCIFTTNRSFRFDSKLFVWVQAVFSTFLQSKEIIIFFLEIGQL